MQTKLIDVSQTTQDQKYQVDADTQYVLVSNGNVSAQTYEFVFSKSGVNGEILVIYQVPEKGQLAMSTITHHTVPDTKCVTKVRGILQDGSTSNFLGKIIIDKKAQKTSSYLFDNVLVTGEGIKNRSDPILQIDANDVSASHAATTGKVSDEEVYYLQSRGLSREESENLISQGFLSSIIFEIKDKKIQGVVVEKFLAKELK